MELGTIFSEKEYEEGYDFALKNNYSIKEVNSRQENVEKEIEYVDDKGEVVIKYITIVEKVRYFQITEKTIYKPTNEEISQQRQNAYTERTDPLTLRKLRKQALGEWTTEDEKEYVAQIQAISEQIASEFPYISEEPTL